MALLDSFATASVAVRTRPAAWAAAATTALAALVVTVTIVAFQAGRTFAGVDGAADGFAALYAAADLVRSGHGGALYDTAVQEWVQRAAYAPSDIGEPVSFALPAIVAWLLQPLAGLSFTGAYAAWMAVNLATLGALLIVMRQHLDGVPPLPRRVFLGVFALSAPVLTDIALGQLDLFVFAGLLGGYLLMRQDRTVLAGAALSLAVVKPHFLLGVVLMLVIWRQWDTLVALAGIGAGVLVLPALAITGMSGGFDNIALAARHLTGALPADASGLASWRAVSATLAGVDAWWLWLPPAVLVAAAVTAVCVECWHASEFGEEPADRSYAVAVLLPLAVLPAAGAQSLLLLFIPLAMGLRALFHPAAPRDEERQLDAAAALLAGYAALTALYVAAMLGVGLLYLVTLAALWASAHRWPVPEATRLPADPLTRLRGLNLTRSSAHRYDRAGSRL